MRKYECKTCGAELFWDSKSGCLKCEYCDSKFSPSDFEDKDTDKKETKTERNIDEHDIATDNSEENATLVVYKCTHCGAEIITAKSTVATTCIYCNRAIALTDKMVGNFKPELVIPFTITQEEAIKIYEKYVQSTFLTPKHFKDENEIKKIKGMYAPFWLHSFIEQTSANLSCENVTHERRGDDKVTKHEMHNVKVDLEGKFIRVPTDALKYLDNKTMSAIEPFDYGKLKFFKPAYMAGYYAESYNDVKADTLIIAQERATKTMAEISKEKAGHFDTKILSHIIDTYEKEVSEYAMLPVWLFNTEYRGKKYTFAINGQTGKISGQLPMSISKLWATSGVVFVISQLIALIIRILMLSA